MLQQLDTLIGFVLVMALVSLLLTIVTQMISTLLGLRGKNLADALEVMIVTLDPDIKTQSSLAAKRLANAVLTHPAISDSVLPMHFTSFLWWRRATAIRADELVAVLEDYAGTSLSAASSKVGELVEISTATRQGKSTLSTVLNQKFSAAQTASTQATNALIAKIDLCRNANDAGRPAAITEAKKANETLRNAKAWLEGLQAIAARTKAEKCKTVSKNLLHDIGNRLAAANLLAALSDPFHRGNCSGKTGHTRSVRT